MNPNKIFFSGFLGLSLILKKKMLKNCMKKALFFDFRIDNSGKWCYISKIIYKLTFIIKEKYYGRTGWRKGTDRLSVR